MKIRISLEDYAQEVCPSEVAIAKKEGPRYRVPSGSDIRVPYDGYVYEDIEESISFTLIGFGKSLLKKIEISGEVDLDLREFLGKDYRSDFTKNPKNRALLARALASKDWSDLLSEMKRLKFSGSGPIQALIISCLKEDESKQKTKRNYV